MEKMKVRSGYGWFALLIFANSVGAVAFIMWVKWLNDFLNEGVFDCYDLACIVFCLIFTLVYIAAPWYTLWLFTKTARLNDEGIEESLLWFKKNHINWSDVKEAGIGLAHPGVTSKYIYFSKVPLSARERSAIIDTWNKKWRKKEKDIIFVDYSDKLYGYLCSKYEGEIMYETLSRDEFNSKVIK